MLQHTLRIGLLVVVLGFVAQEAHAFGRCGGGGRGCGYGGCGYGGYGYGGYGGWGYGGYGYGGYATSPNSGYMSSAGPSNVRPRVSSSQPASDSALLMVSVPADAKVFVNGRPTKSTGESRHYTSTGLQPAAFYPYQVRAEFIRGGKLVSEEKTVQLTAGQTSSLAFSAASEPQMADVATSAQR
jgi:uncharacterized protein (TIGR03000 family)